MAGVLPVNLPAFSAKTDIDQSTDLGLVYDYDEQKLKTRPISDIYRDLLTRPSNTYTINAFSDFVDGYNCTISGSIVTLQNAVYIIGGVINCGSSRLVMINGTAILGDSAQSAQITSSNLITIDTEAGVFNTFIIKGPLRIENTNATGKVVNLQFGSFLIYDGALLVASLAAQYGIYSMSGAVAMSIKNYTLLGAATKLYAYGLLFGGTFDGLQSNSLTGDGLIFDGVAGTTVYGDMIFRNCIVECDGASGQPFFLKGKSAANTSVSFTTCNFVSANNTAGYIESTVGGKFNSIKSIGTDFRNTTGGATKHGLDLTNAYFDVGYFSGGYITTAGTGGSSYAVKADPAKISSFLSFQSVFFANSVTPANLLGGFTQKSTGIDIQQCFPIPNSGVRGGFYFDTTKTGAWTSSGTPGTYTKIFAALAAITTLPMSSIMERVTHVSSAATNSLTSSSLTSRNITLSFCVSAKKTSASATDATFAIYKNGSLLAGSEVTVTMQQNEFSAANMDIPDSVSAAGTDYYELYAKTSTASQALTFTTITLTLRD
jgi:hypothetical protein